MYTSNTEFQKAVPKNSSVEIQKILRDKYPKMSDINRFLLRKDVQDFVWNYLGMPLDCPFPIFDRTLLYGTISEIVHNPDITTILCSDMDPPGMVCFFEALAVQRQFKFVQYKEHLASNVPKDKLL